jgi:hypothetical protein
LATQTDAVSLIAGKQNGAADDDSSSVRRNITIARI